MHNLPGRLNSYPRRPTDHVLDAERLGDNSSVLRLDAAEAALDAGVASAPELRGSPVAPEADGSLPASLLGEAQLWG